MKILRKLIQRELTCEKPVAYEEESTYLKGQIPVGICYDKLKPYSFPIHGCIDGYLRRILWLKVTKSKSHAKVLAAYSVGIMKERAVCPKLLQTDCRTENGLMAAIQSRLQASVNAHRYSSSFANEIDGHVIGKDILTG